MATVEVDPESDSFDDDPYDRLQVRARPVLQLPRPPCEQGARVRRLSLRSASPKPLPPSCVPHCACDINICCPAKFPEIGQMRSMVSGMREAWSGMRGRRNQCRGLLVTCKVPPSDRPGPPPGRAVARPCLALRGKHATRCRQVAMTLLQTAERDGTGVEANGIPFRLSFRGDVGQDRVSQRVSPLSNNEFNSRRLH
jgi:hypothetical protein